MKTPQTRKAIRDFGPPHVLLPKRAGARQVIRSLIGCTATSMPAGPISTSASVAESTPWPASLPPPWARSGRLVPARPGDGRQGTFADTYHGKVVPLDAATQLVTVQEDVDLGDLEQIIPYTKARDLVLQQPDHIVVLECPCRTVRPNPCLPLDVCLIIGEPFASFVAEHHPDRARWISQDGGRRHSARRA